MRLSDAVAMRNMGTFGRTIMAGGPGSGRHPGGGSQEDQAKADGGKLHSALSEHGFKYSSTEHDDPSGVDEHTYSHPNGESVSFASYGGGPSKGGNTEWEHKDSSGDRIRRGEGAKSFGQHMERHYGVNKMK